MQTEDGTVPPSHTASDLTDKEYNYLDNWADNNSVFAAGYTLSRAVDAARHLVLHSVTHNLCLCPHPTCSSVSFKLPAATCNIWQFAPTLLSAATRSAALPSNTSLLFFTGVKQRVPITLWATLVIVSDLKSRRDLCGLLNCNHMLTSLYSVENRTFDGVCRSLNLRRTWHLMQSLY